MLFKLQFLKLSVREVQVILSCVIATAKCRYLVGYELASVYAMSWCLPYARDGLGYKRDIDLGEVCDGCSWVKDNFMYCRQW